MTDHPSDLERLTEQEREIANLRQALLDAHHVVSAIVAAAGGRITVGDSLLMEDYILSREYDLQSFSHIFRVTRANAAEELASARRWRAGP